MDFEHYLNLHKSGNLIEAEKGYRILLKKRKINPNIFTSLGLICNQTGRENESVDFFKKAIEANPCDELALNNLGLIFFKNKKHKKAKIFFLNAIKLSKNAKTYFYLGQIYTELNNYNQAINNFQESIKINDSAEAFCNLGNLLYLKGEIKDAEKYTNLAIKKNPGMDIAYNNKGLICLANGQINKAKSNFIQAIKINKNNFRAYYNLSSVSNYFQNNKHLKELFNLLKSSQNNKEKIYLFFTLGRIFEKKRDFNKSFKYFSLANSIKRKTFQYSINQDIKLFKNIKRIFNTVRINKNNNYGFYDELPIFIVGMPRSGTSLIEQVLSSHSNIYGAGEINLLDEIINKYFISKNNLIDPKLINKNNLYDAGSEYINIIKTKFKTKRYIINKLPLNFRWIGLINLILPKAKIVHCKRDPLDTCLSIFQQNFLIKGNEYSFDLIEIGKYYNLYTDCMKHWKIVNRKKFYEIGYENFIKNQKNETKKLLEFCSLDWEEKCLDFYKTKRSVRTSSDAQVRKTIYTSSINRANSYKREIKEIINILN